MRLTQFRKEPGGDRLFCEMTISDHLYTTLRSPEWQKKTGSERHMLYELTGTGSPQETIKVEDEMPRTLCLMGERLSYGETGIYYVIWFDARAYKSARFGRLVCDLIMDIRRESIGGWYATCED